MTLERKAVKFALAYFEDFEISSEAQKYKGLKVRFMKAITAAVTEERERITVMADVRAKELSHPILGETNDQYWARVGRLEEARNIAAAIRKGKE